ncbi:hypothetical protein N9948_00590 [bacterium]|nr:hypothetical protein [bacterium]
MVVYYGIEIKQTDGSWKLETWDGGEPCKWGSRGECEQSARICHEVVPERHDNPSKEWRVVEIERHENLHATPFGHTVERLDGDIFEGSWDCEKSHTKKCHFNIKKDSACDNCLFCGEPEERL